MNANLVFKIGQKINYSNGSLSIYSGEIVKITDRSLIVVDDSSEMELWKAGYAVGSEISFTQVK